MPKLAPKNPSSLRRGILACQIPRRRLGNRQKDAPPPRALPTQCNDIAPDETPRRRRHRLGRVRGKAEPEGRRPILGKTREHLEAADEGFPRLERLARREVLERLLAGDD